MTTPLGVQVTPWRHAAELVALGQRLSAAVDMIWVQDQMLARSVYPLLGALAQAGCGVGTSVTYPVGRNPVEMASAVATIAELVPADREMAVGMGTGGALVGSLFRTGGAVAAVTEAMALMRTLWAGDEAELDEFPALGAACRYRPGAVARLTYPVSRPLPIMLAGVGPRILAVAGAEADGLICASNMPSQSRAAFRTGRFPEISGIAAAATARPAAAAPLRLVYGINVSVSRDSKRARSFARRQLAFVVGNPRLWPDLAAVGLDVESAGQVKEAFDAGLGLDGAAARMSDSLADALIIAGSPQECAGPMIELRDLATAQGYREFYVGAPLGPDPLEAAELLLSELIPQVWPDRAAARC